MDNEQQRREKKAAQFRAWEQANREKRNAYRRERRKANPERYKKKSREAAAKWRAEHPEESAAYGKAYRSKPEQREKAKEYWKRSGKKKTAKRQAERALIPKAPPAPLSMDPKTVKHTVYMREWRKRNPEKLREHKRINQHNRRVAKKNGRFTLPEWREIISRQNGLCFDCGERRRMTIGHLVPLAKGGLHCAANIVAQCMACNHKQGTAIHPSVRG
jgi:hypothetical protein